MYKVTGRGITSDSPVRSGPLDESNELTAKIHKDEPTAKIHKI